MGKVRKFINREIDDSNRRFKAEQGERNFDSDRLRRSTEGRRKRK